MILAILVTQTVIIHATRMTQAADQYLADQYLDADLALFEAPESEPLSQPPCS